MLNSVALELIGKPGCHLCDDARVVIERVLADHPGIQLTELNILEDDALANRYREEIPVLLINGKVHNYWRIDEARLRVALAEFE